MLLSAMVHISTYIDGVTEIIEVFGQFGQYLLIGEHSPTGCLLSTSENPRESTR